MLAPNHLKLETKLETLALTLALCLAKSLKEFVALSITALSPFLSIIIENIFAVLVNFLYVLLKALFSPSNPFFISPTPPNCNIITNGFDIAEPSFTNLLEISPIVFFSFSNPLIAELFIVSQTFKIPDIAP